VGTRVKLTIAMLGLGLVPAILVATLAFGSIAPSAILPIIIVIIFSGLGGAGVSFWLLHAYAQPIVRVARVAESFGNGDFSSRVDLKNRTDEIGALGNSIDAMGQSLLDYIARTESERNRLTSIINSTVESILAINKDGKILLANAATSDLTQLPQSSLIGKQIQSIFIWRREMQDFPVNYLQDGSNIYPNLEYTDVGNITHYLKLIVTKINGVQDAQSPQTIVTIHDETKSRDLENMKVDFVSMAAHELRTPLAATRGYLELINLQESSNVAPEVKNYLQLALKSTAELGSLIDNLLGVTRIERGTLTLRPEKVDIATDIQQAIRNANFTATDKQIKLNYEGPISGYYVIADQIAIHEVINNLINNAIKYTDPGGSVNVTLARSDKNYVIQFKDTGIGIPKASLGNLFTKFYRVHGGLNSGSTGTGLGLFIAKSIIERHGGSISVESEEGVGSTFTVVIPVLDEIRLAALQQQSPKTTAQPTPTTRGNRGWTTKNIAR
jgi:signal transduction histidine kinase